MLLDALEAKFGAAAADTPDCDPRKLLARTLNYLEKNRDRMKYPKYRQAGLPVTTAWMESLVKEMNYRVKRTEMFWNDPDGAEAILHVRAASLCDDERLTKHLRTRAGCPFTRRPKSPKLAREKIRSSRARSAGGKKCGIVAASMAWARLHPPILRGTL
jgi:hypothetical protein